MVTHAQISLKPQKNKYQYNNIHLYTQNDLCFDTYIVMLIKALTQVGVISPLIKTPLGFEKQGQVVVI